MFFKRKIYKLVLLKTGTPNEEVEEKSFDLAACVFKAQDREKYQFAVQLDKLTANLVLRVE